MRFVEFFWAFFCTFLVPKSGQREVVCGMPIVRGGSKNCSLTILPLPAEASSSYVLFRVSYNAETPLSANSSDCKVVFTSGPEKRTRRIVLQGIFQRDVFLSRGKHARSLIMPSMGKIVERWFKSPFDFVIWISCPDRKFSCAPLPLNVLTSGYDVEHHALHVKRKLLSAEQLTAGEDQPIRNPFKLVLLATVGFVILGIAAGMCANCNKDESGPQTPHLVSMEIRESERKRGEQEEPVEVDGTRQSNDMVFVEGGDKRKKGSVEVAAEEEAAARSQSIKEEDQRREPGVGVDGGDLRRSETDETEHEQHRGKFWKRSRTSKDKGSPSFSHSDNVFREEEHKDRKLRKPAKGKRKESDESDNAERKLSEDSKEQVERHSRELPPPPGEHSAPALPVRPIPTRQFSVPDGSTEDNYEEVEVRRTKSVDHTDNTYILADDLYDAVRDEVVNLRPSSASYEVIGIGSARNRVASDIYEEVDEPSIIVDDLYSTVADGEKEGRELEMRTNEIGSLGSDSEVVQQECEEAEDPYSKVNTSERLELYEEVDKTKENDKFGDQHPAVQTKTDVDAVIVVEVNSGRARAHSEGAKLQRNAAEEANRPHTIHVMQSSTAEEGDTPFDYLYAKVDRSKKLKNRSAAEGSSSQAQTIVEEWEATSEIPPPLPPPYMSSRQIKIEMGWTEEPSAVVVENLYDEVNPGQPMPTKNKQYSKAGNEFVESAQYASVETSVVAQGLNGDVKHGVGNEDEPRYELVTPRAAPVSRNMTPRKQNLTDPIWL